MFFGGVANFHSPLLGRCRELPSSPPAGPTRHDLGALHRQRVHYEVNLLRFWAAKRPVARVQLACVPDRRECRALRATWALQYVIDLNLSGVLPCRGCGAHPTHTTCTACPTNWCVACLGWSSLCWKCYRPRPSPTDCGEFPLGQGGPGGNGGFE